MKITLSINEQGLFRHLTDYEIAMRWTELGISHPTNNQYNHKDNWAWRNSMPMVFWLDGGTKIPLGKTWQLLSYNLNPGIQSEKWEKAWWDNIAFSNGVLNGYTSDTRYPKPNYITGKNLNSPYPLQKDKVRLCGNSVVKIKRIEGEWGIIETLDGNRDAPAVEYVLERPWLWFHAVSVHKTATGKQLISPFLFNEPKPYIVPLVSKTEIKVFMKALQPAIECTPNPLINYPVDPYKTYLYNA